MSKEENKIELDRQEAYIEKCRDYVSSFQMAHGRDPQACVVTFGCQMALATRML